MMDTLNVLSPQQLPASALSASLSDSPILLTLDDAAEDATGGGGHFV
jgi:hypothetical protein